MKTLPLMLATLAIATVPVLGQADETHRFVMESYKRIDAAATRKDSRTMFSFLAPNYRAVMNGKNLTKSDMERNAKKTFSFAQNIRSTTIVRNFSFQKGKAIVIAQELVRFQIVNPHLRKPIQFASDSSFEDTWGKVGARWMKQHTRTLSVKVTANGKPVKLVGNHIRISP